MDFLTRLKVSASTLYPVWVVLLVVSLAFGWWLASLVLVSRLLLGSLG